MICRMITVITEIISGPVFIGPDCRSINFKQLIAIGPKLKVKCVDPYIFGNTEFYAESVLKSVKARFRRGWDAAKDVLNDG